MLYICIRIPQAPSLSCTVRKIKIKRAKTKRIGRNVLLVHSLVELVFEMHVTGNRLPIEKRCGLNNGPPNNLMECENYETKLNYFVRFGISKHLKLASMVAHVAASSEVNDEKWRICLFIPLPTESERK